MSRRTWIVIGAIGLVVVALVALGLVFAPRLMSMGDLRGFADMRGGRGGFRFGGMMLLGGLARLLLWGAQVGLTALIAAWIVRQWMASPAAIAAPSPAPAATTIVTPTAAPEESEQGGGTP